MEYLSWLSLKSVPGIGNLLFKRLIDRFKNPKTVFKAPLEELETVPGISHRIAQSILTHRVPDPLVKDMESALADGCRIILMTDREYPCLLLQIPDPPPFLFVRGRIPDRPAIAVVGSRGASDYGLANARRLSADLAQCGFLVVSGLARGIDTAAHSGVLGTNNPTVAILGNGLSGIYPPENKRLAQKIADSGALISEFPFFEPPEARNFPMRNRIISGMSLGTLVVEAAQKSGSLITARLAAEQNREVFAVPGSIRSFKSSGTHSLLKQGAKLVESIQDIIEEIPLFAEMDTAPNGSPIRSPGGTEHLKNKFNLDFSDLSVLKVLDSYPVHIDDIHGKVSMEPGLLSGILLKLELLGIVNQSPGKLFSLNEDVL
ncbi:MAG: DNA-processing protein DprA [Proteobacteria bacterium]|nr:DNA-processing protein DprA [Pseudomonadota bacterium]